MLNYQVFEKNPLDFTLPNDGVAKVGEPSTADEKAVLRFELRSFVCRGEYERGLERGLLSFLTHLDRPTQPAVWVSGFYGSGKSHLVRVLQHLWRDYAFDDGATARSLVSLPEDIGALFRELTTQGRRAGGLWAAGGKLGGGAGESIRLALLRIVFHAAGLPTNYAQARFHLWLESEGLLEPLRAQLLAAGRSLGRELPHMHVSTPLAQGLMAVSPDFAADTSSAKLFLKEQFPNVEKSEISEEDFLYVFGQVLERVSGTPGRRPLALVVLDELEQYVADSTEKMEKVQEVVEACSGKFGGQLLFVATGQSALQASAQLSKLQGRFTVRVALSDTDVETVLREVVLRKKPDRGAAVADVLERASGEIDRQLAGSKLRASASDKPLLVADYPLLPVRRRFWERVLRAVDHAGTAGQLRTQLRIVFEANREVAREGLGTVVGGDFIYGQLREDMLKSSALQRDIEGRIEGQMGHPDGALRKQLAALIFLISKLPTGASDDTGVRTTAGMLADLLVRDLQGGAALRQRVPEVLAAMTEEGHVLKVGDGYRLQTKESGEWEADYRSRLRGVEVDEATLGSERQRHLKEAVRKAVGSLNLRHGQSKEARKAELFFSAEAPQHDGNLLPIWVRDGWQASEREARDDARALGTDSPVVTVFLPREGHQELRSALAQLLAAEQVLVTRAEPTTSEGHEAKAAMESRKRQLEGELSSLVNGVVRQALVLQGGGTEVGGDLREAVLTAAENALERLYPEFRTADDPRWTKVMARAKAGNPDALGELDYRGDPDKQPVVAKVLELLRHGPRLGRELRKGLSAPPYGWPQDATDGALVVLVGAGQLRAEGAGQPLAATQLDQAKLGQTTFRLEATVVTLPQRMAVRKLLTDAGVPYRKDEEAAAAVVLTERLKQEARAAGGDPPAPSAPQPPYLVRLESLRGNELLLELVSHDAPIREDLKAWRAQKAAVAARLPRWRTLERLVAHAAALPEAAELRPQLQAVVAQRGLLAEPDPAVPIAQRAAEGLRGRLKRLYVDYARTLDDGLASLKAHSAWQALEPDEAEAILEGANVQRLAEPALATESDLLAALDALSIKGLEDRLAALPGRLTAALAEALRRLTPEAVHLKPPSAQLRDEADVTRYLKALEAEIMQHIRDGRPVIL